MTGINAALVKTLRDRTGAGVIACKRALTETHGDLEAAAHAYRDIERMVQFTEQWTGGKPRWLIMFLKAFKLPGGEGVLPDPFLKYADAEYERFTKGMLELNIPEINEMALAAGLKTAH